MSRAKKAKTSEEPSEAVQNTTQSTKELSENLVKRTKILFQSGIGSFEDESSAKDIARIKINAKLKDEYEALRKPKFIAPGVAVLSVNGQQQPQRLLTFDGAAKRPLAITFGEEGLSGPMAETKAERPLTETEIMQIERKAALNIPDSTQLIKSQLHQTPKPKWHPPWKLMRVISGHIGWVRAVAVDPSNEWFATGAGDRLIKIWDLASGTLKLSLTGHVSTVRGLAVSDRHPYLFSCGEDNEVKCWDLEVNKVVRHYHGHLSGVFCLAIHPTLDVLITGGRDSVARVWDIRTRQQVHILSGHEHSVISLLSQEADPQVITGSMDNTIRLWDLAAGKTMTTLTHHKKSIRALVKSDEEFTFASGAADNIKKWKCPEGKFMMNFRGHNSIINTLSLNQDNVMFSGADNGTMQFWDWKSGYCFQKMDTIAQPGSLESENGVFCSAFDKSGTRLITGEADKTIKIWKEDELATEESHPIDWNPTLKRDHY